MREVKSRRYTLTLGFFSTGKYEQERGGLLVSQVARINNFGTVNPETGVRIPPRPFLTTMPVTHGKQWKQLFQRMTATHVDLRNYKVTLEIALEHVALQMQAQLQKNITDWRTPPNSPATIAAKSRNGKIKDNPLIDDGTLRRNATCKFHVS